eukprot:COSAG03_NODE_18705_length_350_cov_0.617530_1_plen_69_part_01
MTGIATFHLQSAAAMSQPSPPRMDGGSEPAKGSEPAHATSRQPQHRSTELAPRPWLRPLPAQRERSGCC